MPISYSDASSVKRSDMGTGSRIAAILCALSLVLFTLSVREGTGPGVINSVKSMVTTVTMPVRVVGSVIFSPLEGLGNVMRNLTVSQETLSELKAENERLQARNVELEEAELTAARLQDLLDLKSTYQLDATSARVISGTSDAWSSTLIIDKGSVAGLSQGMPVMDSNGVIGQISSVGTASATVRLIGDENSSVSAMIQTTRAQGMLRGSADGTLKLTLVGIDQTVEVGNIVVTSGLGGVYPKGLPLGIITNVERTAGSLYYDITVRGFSTGITYEEVLVITNVSESQQASTEDLDEADAQQRGWVEDTDNSQDNTTQDKSEEG